MPDNAAMSATSWTVHTSATTIRTLRVMEEDLSSRAGGAAVGVCDIKGLPWVIGGPESGRERLRPWDRASGAASATRSHRYGDGCGTGWGSAHRHVRGLCGASVRLPER